MTLELINKYYRYNAWANDRIMGAAGKLSPAQLAAPGCSGNGSVMQTLAHLLITELEWFQWYIHGDRVYGAKIETLEQAIDGGTIETLEEAHRRWPGIHALTQGFIDGLTEETLHAARSFTMPDGTTYAIPLWELLLHTANHATHTRAQIIAAIRREGVFPGYYDLLHFSLYVK